LDDLIVTSVFDDNGHARDEPLGISDHYIDILAEVRRDPWIEDLSKNIDKNVPVVVRRIFGPDTGLARSNEVFWRCGAHVLMMKLTT
jgi:hypothetical protein